MQKLNSITKFMIVFALLTNSIGMFFPLLNSTFSPYYGSIAKHITLTNDWIDLVFSGRDWLDKPHLPFWLTAVSFKFCGVNSFSYILPGFLFHIIGLYYTYCLARFWYTKEIGLLATLLTATTFHLMSSSIDVRAESYLLGGIMGACYYWVRFEYQTKLKYLFLGALFTAMALMTKGIFVIITIMSGLSCLWIYKRQWKRFISIKWVGALVLSFILIFPEILSLYIQFDLHPEKTIFGQQHVSGVKWYFWDSQFGRFFGTGPIHTSVTSPFYQLFFVHTFLWAYLPWWPMFFAGVYASLRNKRFLRCEASIYFYASFFITFILFSVTKFQVDHYTNILFPFASIICASWFSGVIKDEEPHKIFYVEIGLSLVLILAIFILMPFMLSSIYILLMGSLLVVSFLAIFFLSKFHWVSRTIFSPVIAILVSFIFVTLVNGTSYVNYDAGYQIATYLNKNVSSKVFGYKVDLLSLDLHSKNQYTLLSDLYLLSRESNSVYLVIDKNEINNIIKLYPDAQIIQEFNGCNIETYMRNAFNPQKLLNTLTKYLVLEIKKPIIK